MNECAIKLWSTVQQKSYNIFVYNPLRLYLKLITYHICVFSVNAIVIKNVVSINWTKRISRYETEHLDLNKTLLTIMSDFMLLWNEAIIAEANSQW